MNEHRIKPEPSMEEILASIREIIAAGEKAANQPTHPSVAHPTQPAPAHAARALDAAAEPEVFELTEMVNDDGSVVTLQAPPTHNSARPITPQPAYDHVPVGDIAETPYMPAPIDPPPAQLMEERTTTVPHRRAPAPSQLQASPVPDPDPPRVRPTGRPPAPNYSPQPDGYHPAPTTTSGDTAMDRRHSRDNVDARRARPPAPDADNPFADLARAADEQAGIYDEPFDAEPPRREKSQRPRNAEPDDLRSLNALSEPYDDREFDFRIEDLVREQVEPVVREWLDNHLQPMVERIVRDEIRHLFSRRRS